MAQVRFIQLGRAAAVLSAIALSSVPARAADAPCLWDAAPPHAQLRLELAVRMGEALPTRVLAALGPEWLAQTLDECGFEPNPANLDFMLQYWSARASEPVFRVELASHGVSVVEADDALEAEAPRATRAATATDIILSGGAVDQPAVRAAIERLADAQSGPSSAARRALAGYFAAQILVDGLELIAAARSD